MNDQSRTDVARQWIIDTADAVALRHVISARTVRGWLATGKVGAEVAEHLANLADYGIDPDMLNAMVSALDKGRPIGDLDEFDVEVIE